MQFVNFSSSGSYFSFLVDDIFASCLFDHRGLPIIFFSSTFGTFLRSVQQCSRAKLRFESAFMPCIIQLLPALFHSLRLTFQRLISCKLYHEAFFSISNRGELIIRRVSCKHMSYLPFPEFILLMSYDLQLPSYGHEKLLNFDKNCVQILIFKEKWPRVLQLSNQMVLWASNFFSLCTHSNLAEPSH